MQSSSNARSELYTNSQTTFLQNTVAVSVCIHPEKCLCWLMFCDCFSLFHVEALLVLTMFIHLPTHATSQTNVRAGSCKRMVAVSAVLLSERIYLCWLLFCNCCSLFSCRSVACPHDVLSSADDYNKPDKCQNEFYA